ncbi:four-carbon acid sugar kinase family protein [Desulfopila aestuarii]|uniref:Uncharacterized conserved protein YgbK, DUF1537 family n=1 Tax=Desulfopila aestuarii DSM 18488 TaxID=1121416 RepID=A0A1M7XWR8_9BACT|nr:four-carbon acid sugar kinase family protein [Desulfopila aestuarii]SHO43089.1 Uncharacterized conserved protein YgbK, DUF1537 family [Desulfopila aestuarii DSM 18488]
MSPKTPYLFCGDDFTGASDTLATLSRAGLNCRLFLSPDAVLNCPEQHELDAIGIATATRSLPPAAITLELTKIAKAFASLSPDLIHYKVCSTFDSSPEIGSIGTAINTFRQILPNGKVMIIGGQPSLRRYCVFSNLFAAATNGEIHRIDRHPTMANHPVTPMHEADLRDVLTAQGVTSINAIHLPAYQDDFATVREKVRSLLAAHTALLFDVHDPSDLKLIGRLMQEQLPKPLLVVGSSSVAEAYSSAMTDQIMFPSTRTPSTPKRPVFILAGSRSQATAIQVENAKDLFFKVSIDPAKIEQNREHLLSQLTRTSLQQLSDGNHVMAVVESSMEHHLTRTDVASFTAKLAAKIALSGELDRLCIAGGDTSSLALQWFGVDSLSFLADIEPGLCLCQLHCKNNPAIDDLQIVLKGGQMGSPDLFSKIAGAL